VADLLSAGKAALAPPTEARAQAAAVQANDNY